MSNRQKKLELPDFYRFKKVMLAVEEAIQTGEKDLDKILKWATQYGRRAEMTKVEAMAFLSYRLCDFLDVDGVFEIKCPLCGFATKSREEAALHIPCPKHPGL